MKNLAIMILLFFAGNGHAQNADINNFMVKESLLKNSKLAVIAADSLDVPNESISGAYTFSISGFTQTLNFNSGVAIIPLQIDKSTFAYIKHENDKGTHSKLLYVYKKDGNLNPITVSGIYLIVIPLIIVILAFAFKKFLYLALVLLVIFFIFGYSNGLNVSTFFETTFDYLKNLV